MKTVFVTLLMIGIAMGQAPAKLLVDQSKYKCPVGQEADWNSDREACPAGEMCVVQVKCYPKPAKPSAKKAEPKPFKCDPTKLQSCASQANDDYGPGRRGLVGEIDWSAPASKYLKAAPPPLDVPAIRKTRVIHPKGTCWAEGQQAVCAMQKDDTEDYWDCEDRDAYSLQISVSQKNANCHRIVP